MKSKTLFFNAGVSKNLLRRCWPLWAGYFGVLLLALPGTVYNNGYMRSLGYQILGSGTAVATVPSFIIAILTAMAMFSFLYNTRSCGMMTSLPIRRETLFLTVYLTGLVPLLAADALAALLTGLFVGTAAAPFLLQWFVLAVLGNIAFYGFAVFCAMLTGSMLILPAVYLVLSLTAYVAEGCVGNLMGMFVYGFRDYGFLFRWLSPVVELSYRLDAAFLEGSDTPVVIGWGSLAAYCAAGLAFSAVALWLYRRRRMETATDTVAIPILKPIFRYCMSVGSALVFACVVDSWIFNSLERFAAAAVIALLLVVGAFLGWYAAEMLMQKTLRVFRGPWKGCAAICCVLVALTMCLEFDLFGIERRVPAAEEIERVNVGWNATLSQPENIEQVVRLHRQIIDNKQRNENAGCRNGLIISYKLKNGKALSRFYRLDDGDEALTDPGSDVRQTQRLMNLPEAVENRSELGKEIPVRQDTVSFVQIRNYSSGETFTVPQEQSFDFVRNCLLADLADCTMGRVWYVQSPEFYERNTDWSITVYMNRIVPGEDGEPYSEDYSYHYTLQMDAERCMAWIKANTGLDIQPVSVTDPDYNPLPATVSW